MVFSDLLTIDEVAFLPIAILISIFFRKSFSSSTEALRPTTNKILVLGTIVAEFGDHCCRVWGPLIQSLGTIDLEFWTIILEFGYHCFIEFGDNCFEFGNHCCRVWGPLLQSLGTIV